MEEPSIGRCAELGEMLPQDLGELRRDRHTPGSGARPVLEARFSWLSPVSDQRRFAHAPDDQVLTGKAQRAGISRRW
jgi:hypothetical protein